MMQAWPVSMVQHGSLCNGVDGVVGVGDVDGIGSDSETWPGCSIALWPWPMHPGLRHSKPWLRWVIHRFSHLRHYVRSCDETIPEALQKI